MMTNDERAADLRARYGFLLTMSELAVVLRYPSVGAILKARLRDRLPVPVFQMPHRKQWFATSESVAAFLCSQESESESAPDLDGPEPPVDRRLAAQAPGHSG